MSKFFTKNGLMAARQRLFDLGLTYSKPGNCPAPEGSSAINVKLAQITFFKIYFS